VPNPPTPAERLATVLLSLSEAANPRSLVGRMLSPLLLLLMELLQTLEQNLTQLAARIEAARPATVPGQPIRQNTRRQTPRTRRRRSAAPTPRLRAGCKLPAPPEWRTRRIPRARYVFGLPYPPPLPVPARSTPVPWHVHIVTN
jgi:hypothetical protein